MSVTLIFLPAIGFAVVAAAAGFAVVVLSAAAEVVVSFFDAADLTVGAGAAAIGSSFFCAGAGAWTAGASDVVSTLADGFSSLAGAVDSAGAGDSSCAKLMAARKSEAKSGMIIFMVIKLVWASVLRGWVEGGSYSASLAMVKVYRDGQA